MDFRPVIFWLIASAIVPLLGILGIVWLCRCRERQLGDAFIDTTDEEINKIELTECLIFFSLFIPVVAVVAWRVPDLSSHHASFDFIVSGKRKISLREVLKEILWDCRWVLTCLAILNLAGWLGLVSHWGGK